MVGVGKNTTNIVEEFPTPSPLPGDEDSELPKTVWVANGNVQGEEASVDCYVRVSLGYSNSDIGRAVTLKQIDRTNWVEADDGFYYYKKVLREGEKTTPLFSGISVDSSKLEKLLEYQNDTKVLNHFLKIKQKNKQKLCMHLKEKQDLDIDPNSIFDIQIKRLHEYKKIAVKCALCHL